MCVEDIILPEHGDHTTNKYVYLALMVERIIVPAHFWFLTVIFGDLEGLGTINLSYVH